MNITKANKTYYYLFFASCLLLLFTMIPIESFAATSTTADDALSESLCRVVIKLTGPIGKGVAMIAIVVLGIGLFLGKLSWAVAVATAIGIGMIFGSASIVDWVGGSSGTSSLCTGK